MKRFKLFNNIVGWVVFAIAAFTYLMTIEPTASFWDCGEFISTANKLEVGHPPGAPFFMLTARFFTLFASDQAHVAMMVNSFSAICSALCILFLFWTITHLARKLVVKETSGTETQISVGQMIGILGAGVVGALAYTFSDTFWFSAVEGEVYAYSSLFTAVVFWAILKWEDVADRPYANRWLVLIAYLMGLSVGVHLLNLLTIPALVLVYYFKKYEATVKGAIIAMLASCVILGLILYGVVPGFVEVAGWFELFFVNTLGFSFNVGTVIYAILLIACLVWGIWETMREPQSQEVSSQTGIKSKKEEVRPNVRANVAFLAAFLLMGIPFLGGRIFVIGLLLTAGLALAMFLKPQYFNMKLLNTILLCCMVILLGYSTYATVIIRSAANTPMDQNSPDDVFALKSYLNREQYGDTPLLYGESYASEFKRVREGNSWVMDIEEGENLYAKKIKTSENEKDSYEAYDKKKTYKYDLCMPFPRMYSKQAAHIEAYKQWGNIKGKKVRYEMMGETKTKVVPTFGENLRFFFSYQVGFMYWRYFMWNFVGRQNDIQGHGGVVHGNWISGIDAIDSLFLGDQTNLPDELKNNKGRNTYYFLPLILGILGILYQFSKSKKGTQSFWITFALFFMTGLAIVLYLNQTPYQPRERDYAYAGSFYAFCIWIGLGVLYIAQLLKKVVDEKIAASVATVACLSVPVLMAQQNWDDHDRSGRYTCRDFGQDYLLTLEPNAVIFTNGDNDTFPLWYNQEVEGVGTDARVANLSYLQMGWYVDQMKRQAYESDPLPLSLTSADYMNGRMDIAYLFPMLSEMSIPSALDVAKNPKKYAKLNPYADEDLTFIPSKKFILPVNADSVIAAGAVSAGEKSKIVDQITLNLSSKSYLGKHEMMILDLLQNNNWKRPIYFAVTTGSDAYMGMQKHLSLEGMAYRVLPKTDGIFARGEMVNTDRMYDNMLHKFKWGGIAENPDIYLEENNLRMTSTLRFMFVRLVDALKREARKAEMEEDYSKVLRAFLSKQQSQSLTSSDMRLLRQYVSLYYKDANPSELSDSLLNVSLPKMAAEVLNLSEVPSTNDLINGLTKHIDGMDSTAVKAYVADRESKAVEVLDFAEKVLPEAQVPYTSVNLMMANSYIELGEKEKGEAILEKMMETSRQYLVWITNLRPSLQSGAIDELREKLSIFTECLSSKQDANEATNPADFALYKKAMEIYQKYSR